MTKKNISAVLTALAILVFYQNCDFVSSDGSQSYLKSANNGQPYDGKLFVQHSKCSDGTVVAARISLKSDAGAILHRDNCKSITPREIAAKELRFDPSDAEVVYVNGSPFVMERPAIPLPGVISWFYQLTGLLRARHSSIYIIDMFANDEVTIASLKQAGHTVICSISAGTVESWNPDAASFPSAAIGRPVDSSKDERWVDFRYPSVRSIMISRLDIARDKGCHGVDFDSVDGYANDTGFSLSPPEQLEYNQFLAFAAHDRRLILALNNAPELAGTLANVFDFAIAEECFAYNECQAYQEFIKRAKPVLALEYTSYSESQCSAAESQKLSLAFFNRELDGTRDESCRR